MSSLGVEEGVIAAVSYFPVVGLVMLILEKKSNFVRFHSLQSTFGYAIILMWWMLIKWIPQISFLAWSPGLLGIGFTIYMAYQAYHGEEAKMPLIGRLAFGTVFETGPEPEDFLVETPPQKENPKS